MELYEQHVVNLSFTKTNDIDEIKSFREVIEVLNKEIDRASLLKLRFTKDQSQIIKNLHSILKEHESYTDKTDN